MTVREYWEKYNEEGDAYMSLPKYDYVDIVIYPEYDDEYDRFVVGVEGREKEYYDEYYPIEDIVKEFEETWGEKVEYFLKSLKEDMELNEDFYMGEWFRSDVDYYQYKMIITEGADYGIKFKECFCPYKGYYIEF
jgi:hypothetical protein